MAAREVGVPMLPLTFRPPQTTRELNLVRSSWTHSMSRTRPVRVCGDEHGGTIQRSGLRVVRMDRRVFFEGHARQVDAVIARTGVLLAVPEATASTIAGWACAEPGVVHYVYVVETFRKLGVARALLEAIGIEPRAFSQWSNACDRGLGSKLMAAGWVWDPTRF